MRRLLWSGDGWACADHGTSGAGMGGRRGGLRIAECAAPRAGRAKYDESDGWLDSRRPRFRQRCRRLGRGAALCGPDLRATPAQGPHNARHPRPLHFLGTMRVSGPPSPQKQSQPEARGHVHGVCVSAKRGAASPLGPCSEATLMRDLAMQAEEDARWGRIGGAHAGGGWSLRVPLGWNWNGTPLCSPRPARPTLASPSSRQAGVGAGASSRPQQPPCRLQSENTRLRERRNVR